jgi:esterase/lipase superfamily enzyme
MEPDLLFYQGMKNLISLAAVVGLFLTSSLTWALDQESQKKVAQELGCKAAIGAEERDLLVCFRDDVLDAGKPTEIQGCAVRLYDLEEKKFLGYNRREDETPGEVLLAPQACLQGGLQKILKYPIDEKNDLEKYIRLAYARVDGIYDLFEDESSPVSQLIKSIREENDRLRANEAGEARMAPPGLRLAAPPAPRGESRHATLQVFYGTDRKFVAGKPPAETFVNDRADQETVTLGVVNVSIPASHKFAQLELPPVYKIVMTPDPDRHIVVKSIARLNSADFHKLMAKRVSQSPRKDLFVFVHGYNTSFEESAQRTAQLAFDMKFPGAPVFYSWPAETLLRYAIAEKNVEWSLPHLTKFLREITQKSGANEIHLIAHSMGNRALTNALNAMAAAKSVKPKTFKNVILAAPDVDQRYFRQIAPNVESMTKKLTLYASQNDKALQISQKIHEAPRLGQAGDSTLSLPIMDTVDASAVDSSMLGHSYYGDNASVVTDIEKVVMQSLPIYRRDLDPKLNVTNELFWQIPKPSGIQRLSTKAQ